MRDLSRFETVSPLAMLGGPPRLRPRGPVRWSFDDRPARERPTLLRECFARLGGHCDFQALPDAPFHVDLAIHRLPGLVMIAGSLHGSRSRGAREVAAETGDDVALTVGLKGSHHIEQRNRAIVLGEGEAAFTSCADRSIVRHGGRSEMLVLRFPKTRFAPLVDGPDDRMVRRIPSESPALRLLRSYLTAAWDQQADAGPDVQRSLVTHAYDLMAVMMGATRDAAALTQQRGVSAARLYAIKCDIDRNLALSDLTVETLALRHRCTARSIQRMFEVEGTTFTNYVLTQRLARAYELLGDPRRRAEKISSVALDCGFADASYFNRVFRRHYGASPSDVRAQAPHAVVTSGRRDN
jgi:AraC-like DNA-binding protein